MDTCGHCHNVLPRTVDRCTVCGTERVDPLAADVRRRDDGDAPAHAPGWAAPIVPSTGIHPDDFLRELSGEDVTTTSPRSGRQHTAATDTPFTPALVPRPVPSTPQPGALGAYLGTTVNRRPSDPGPTGEPGSSDVDDASPPPPAPDAPPPARSMPTHLSTATRVAPDGVAARTTRLDGTVKLGPTSSHRLLTIGTPLLAGLLLIGGIAGSYRIRTSQADELEAAAAEPTIDSGAVAQSRSAVVRLDLDGCGIVDQTTGFLFADQTILVPRSAIETDNRPTVVLSDGSTHPAEVIGWSAVRNLAVVRAEERLSGGVRWGVSARVASGDAVSVLALAGPGVATPAPATVVETNTVNGINTSFQLDVRATEGSLVLNADGFVIGVIDAQDLAQVSDDVAPAMSRVILSNDRPQAVCPPPATTVPPEPIEGDVEGTANGTEDTAPDE